MTSEPKMPWDEVGFYRWIESKVDNWEGLCRAFNEHDFSQLCMAFVSVLHDGYKQGQEAQQARITELERLLREVQEQVGDGTLLRHCLTPNVRNKIDTALNAKEAT